MSEDKKPFTINDRRHFTPEGESRPEAPPEQPPPQPEPEASREPAPEPPSLDFINLLVSLGAQASTLLGLGPPEAGATAEGVDLGGARSVIGLLEILEKKTQGRLTKDETEVLAGILYELRMAYLARAR